MLRRYFLFLFNSVIYICIAESCRQITNVGQNN